MDPERLKRRAVEKGLVSEAEVAAMIERDAWEPILRPGFSTAAAVTDFSGRGVGTDVVRQTIAALKERS